jgi:drug/metabolite transporter (DMT)-like permease
MTRKSAIIFALVGILWGVPYLFIKVAVDETDGYPPAIVVFGRVFIGALILIPLALRDKSIFAAFKGIKYVAIYALLEMIIPWLLIGTAEQKISSGLAGLLIASVPIWSTLITYFQGDKEALRFNRLLGIGVGFIGVVLIVGIESLTGSSHALSILMVLVAAFAYAYAIIMIREKLPDVSGIAINAVAMGITAIFYLPFTIALWPDRAISTDSTLSVIALGVFSTGIAFAIFFTLIEEIGPTRASVVTYWNTAIAVLLGVLILNEELTIGIRVGLPLVMIGSYLVTRREKV